MKITVYTPIHKTIPEILDTLKSLENQTDKDFEWLILLNGGAKDKKSYLETKGFNKSWIKIHVAEETGNIGSLKGKCCDLIEEGVCVELDYDDLLTEDAIESIRFQFSSSAFLKFLYSNSAQFKYESKDKMCIRDRM